jgi:hypothetical protein
MEAAVGQEPTPIPPTSFSDAHAILIGAGGDLPVTVDDAKGIQAVLEDEGRCGYRPEHVACLTARDATRERVLTAFDELQHRATAESTVIVYFSGHGYREDRAEGPRYWLMPYGHDTGNLADTAIAGEELTAALNRLPARCLMLLLDCCHAGGLEGAKTVGMQKAAIPLEAAAVLAGGRGRAVIASSKSSELSFAGRPYSAFTAAVLEALCGRGASKQDGFVRLADVALHAAGTVPRKTRDRQHPVFDFEQADNFPVAWYAGGDPAPKALPYPEPVIEDQPGRLNFDLRQQINVGQNLGIIQQDFKVQELNQYTNATQVQQDDAGARLTALKAKPAAEPLGPLLERVEQVHDAGRVTGETAQIVIEALDQVVSRLERGEDLKDVEHDLRTGGATGFLQERFNVETLNQAKTLLQVSFHQAASEVAPQPEPDIAVPIVLLVMTSDEAAALASGEAHRGMPGPVRTEFRRFRRMLDGADVTDWVSRYHEKAEDWQPFGPGEPTIKVLVEQALEVVREDAERPLVPDFVDLQQALDDRERLRELRHQGCVIVVDAVSLRHPDFQVMLQKSHLDAYQRNAVVTIAPMAGAFDAAKNLLLVLRLTLAELEIEKRRSDPWEDYHVCHRTAERNDLQRWLQDRAKRLARGKTGIHAEMQIGS